MAGRAWRTYLSYLAGFALAILLVVQVTVATGFGLTNGLATSTLLNQDARALVSEQFELQQPGLLLGLTKEVACELYSYSYQGESRESIRDAVADQLGEFSPGSDHYYHGASRSPAAASSLYQGHPAGCPDSSSAETDRADADTAPHDPRVRGSAPGDTLWALTARYLGKSPALSRAVRAEQGHLPSRRVHPGRPQPHLSRNEVAVSRRRDRSPTRGVTRRPRAGQLEAHGAAHWCDARAGSAAPFNNERRTRRRRWPQSSRFIQSRASNAASSARWSRRN